MYFLCKIQNKSLTLFGIKVGWKKNLERTFSDENSSITFSISTLVGISMFNTYQCQMIEAILSHGASGLFSVFGFFSLQ